MSPKAEPGGISVFALRLMAMLFMLLDHIWATSANAPGWMTLVGRLAFPIFAFLLVEGYFHTRNLKKYLLRLLVFALVSELPFNLVAGGSWLYPWHQNVMWTFLISLLCVDALERARAGSSRPALLGAIGLSALGFVVATLLMVDYYGFGLLMVLTFYLFRGRGWTSLLGQLAGMFIINALAMGGRVIPLEAFGAYVELPEQAFALLALPLIWLYRGRQGPHSRAIQYAGYAFYPLHLLILGLRVLLVRG